MTPDRNLPPPEGFRRCPACAGIFPKDNAHWSILPKARRHAVGKAVACLACCGEGEGPNSADFNTAAMFKAPGTSSRAAAKADKAAKLTNTHRKLWAMLRERPRTPDELADETGMVLNTCRARLSELKRDGWIAPTGETRTTDAGDEADVLAITDKRRAA